MEAQDALGERNRLKRPRRWPRWLLVAVMCIVGVGAADFFACQRAAVAQDSDTTTDEEGSDTDGKSRSFLSWLMDAGIVWLVIFLLLSLISVYFIIEHSMTIRKGKIMPEWAMAELEQRIARGEINESIEFCLQPENYCLACEVILSGLERYQGSEFGFAEYKTAVEEAGEDQTGRLFRKTEVLGVIGAISPMLGLTGTVLGMISAFNTIAMEGGAAKPDKLAGGIGQALVTTLLGLVLAIPTMVAYSYFRNKIESLVAEAGKRIERIMMPLGRKR